MTTRKQKSRVRQRGSALIEFVFAFTLFWLPLFVGTMTIGFNLIRAMQITQVCRDAGHMYSQGIDFSNDMSPNPYQTLLTDLASGLGMTTTGGNAVIILTTITYIDQTACTAGGIPSCSNLNSYVITRQIVLGNSSIHSSAFGTPPSGDFVSDNSGNVTSAGYLNDTRCKATGFSTLIPMSQSGQFAYVSEAWANSPSWWVFFGNSNVSSRSIF